MINEFNQKISLLGRSLTDIYVITHKKADGTIEYVANNDFAGYKCISLYETWFEAAWYENRADAESQIAESARNMYSVEHIHLSRDSMNQNITVTKEPPNAKFKCACGCEFEAPVGACERTTSVAEGKYNDYIATSFWLKCPRCGYKCCNLE